MGSFENKNPFVCCSGDCLRKAWVDHDMGGFLCFVCDQRLVNHWAVHTLNAMLSKNPTPTLDGTPTFQDLLAEENLCIKILEGVFGDGWDEQCPCRLCNRKWLNAGWVCPAMYYRREYIYILDARHKAKSDHLYMETEDWDALVLAIHFEYHPPPVIELVASSGSAQPPPAPDSRRHSRSRSRSRSSHRSSVVQPAHISKQWCTSCTGAHLCLRPHLAASRRYEAPRDFDTSRITAATLQPQML